MNQKTPTLIPLLFFCSGAAGLMYEIVWTRMLVLVFGNTTHSIVAVVAAFLAGLALGSFAFGKRTDKYSSIHLLRLYGMLEFGVGAAALGSKVIIENIVPVYSALAGASGSVAGVVAAKFIVASVAVLLPAILMGATLPALMSFVELQYRDTAKHISMLYAINTFGGIMGVLVAGFILIELIGISGTLYAAVSVNMLVGLVALRITGEEVKPITGERESVTTSIRKREAALLAMYAISGLTAIGYQVLWTRMLTPRLGTVIYTFSSILAIYLFGIAFGSLLYHRFLSTARARGLILSLCQLAIAICALGSVFLVGATAEISTLVVLLGVILPATILMGISFPLVVVLVNGDGRSGKNVGVVYASNSAGSIAGAFLASFVLLPAIGTAHSILLLGIANILIALFVSRYERPVSQSFAWRAYPVVITVLLTGCVMIMQVGRENFYERTTRWLIGLVESESGEYRLLEDEVASVFASTNDTRTKPRLYIDGVATTMKVAETRLMAHLPVALHANPERMLIVAFGMGSTFRSALLHGLQVDAVELVPSVPKVFDLFYADASSVLRNPNGRIIINDGRNYILMTNKQYDIVTIDPPPPFNSAGTTVLYARDFYRQIIPRLREGGLVCQWIWFGSRQDDVAMAMKSFTESFESVAVFRSFWDTQGVFLIGSQAPIVISPERFHAIFTMDFVTADFAEVMNYAPPGYVLDSYLADKETMERALQEFPPITDNHPRTEYYFLRHSFTTYPLITIDWFQERLQSRD
ncbi:MAG TPA: fused MFS/spermidine synthase [Bacteroidota bacterium]